MELFRIPMTGRPLRLESTEASPPGVLGLDIAAGSVDGDDHVAVQLLLDDDVVGFDRTWMDGPIVAELVDSDDDTVMLRELFDHDSFRRRLAAEREEGRSETRGVLVLTGGELPPPWIRLCFVPIALAATDGAHLLVRRSTVADLREGIDAAFARGAVGEQQRATLLEAIEQRHPDGGEPR